MNYKYAIEGNGGFYPDEQHFPGEDFEDEGLPIGVLEDSEDLTPKFDIDSFLVDTSPLDNNRICKEYINNPGKYILRIFGGKLLLLDNNQMADYKLNGKLLPGRDEYFSVFDQSKAVTSQDLKLFQKLENPKPYFSEF